MSAPSASASLVDKPLSEAMSDEEKINPTGRASLEDDLNTSLCCPSFLSCFVSSICPQTWLCACTVVPVRHAKVVLHYGRLTGILRTPGCFCVNPAGASVMTVNTAMKSVELPNVKVADLNGNPLLISGIVTYEIVDAKKAALDTQNVDSFVRTQALAVMKRVASQFPYESRATLGVDHPHEDCLKGENARVRSMLVHHLQEKINPAGSHVLSFDLTDLSYAPEIAQAMLVRQQAGAMLEARKLIVTGAVEIAHDVLRNLEKKGIILDMSEQARLTNNLLVTIVSEKAVSAQISLNETTSHALHK